MRGGDARGDSGVHSLISMARRGREGALPTSSGQRGNAKSEKSSSSEYLQPKSRSALFQP